MTLEIFAGALMIGMVSLLIFMGSQLLKFFEAENKKEKSEAVRGETTQNKIMNYQKQINKQTTASKIKDSITGFVFILLIGILIVITLNYIGRNPSKDDCVIGRDSPDCLDGGGGGHPLWR